MSFATLDPSVPVQRTEKGLRYEKWIRAIREMLSGMSKKERELAKQANLDFIRGISNPRYTMPGEGGMLERAVTPSAVHIDSTLSTLSVMYANDEYVGERLLGVASVSKRSDKYFKYDKRNRFAFPDDEIGSRASPNELNETRSTDNYSVRDYGYKNFLDLETIQNQDAPLDEMVDVVEAINEGIAFRREKRISSIVLNASNYGGNTAGASTKWDNASTTIITDILGAMAALWTGPNPTKIVMVCGLEVWNKGIINSPAIKALFSYVRDGLATPQQVAAYFGIDELIIGRAREDTANEGQAASYNRIWATDNVAILRVAARPTTRSLQFGTTFREQGDPVAAQWTDPSIGKRGGIWAKVTVSEDHKIVAPDAGFLITDVLT